jgi:pimeloyl-ACP methyl ester carboxylesterase
MRLTCHRPGPVLAGASLTGLAALLLTPAAAQPPKDQSKQEVTIPTVDGVELKGTYYKGGKGKDSPVAILLHQYGLDRTKGDWDKLAKELQTKMGFAVMTFDFRGHGGSTTVIPDAFWRIPHNSRRHISGWSERKQSIRYQDFKNSYKPYLVNDIAAVRKYLDKKNDASECNTSNIFVIGAQEGAVLGMMWVASEWQRDGIAPQLGGPPPPRAGKDIFGCAWLSTPRPPQGARWNADDWDRASPQMREQVPMCFFYGEKDPVSAQAAKYYVNSVLKSASNSPRNTDTFDYAIKNTQLTGVGLLGNKERKADEFLFRYIDKALQRRGGSAVWQQRGNFPDALVPLHLLGVGG